MVEAADKIRTRFKAMDVVPEWLLAAEPMHPAAQRGTIRFTMVTDVIDAGDYYVVVPVGRGSHPLGCYSFDGQGCQIAAPSKPVETMVVKSTIVGTDYADLRTSTDVVTQIPPPLKPVEEVRQLPVLDTRPVRWWHGPALALCGAFATLAVILGVGLVTHLIQGH